MKTPMPNGSQRSELSPLQETRDRILDALRGLRFGSVEVQVHDSQVVRITRTEKVRIEGVRDHSDERT